MSTIPPSDTVLQVLLSLAAAAQAMTAALAAGRRSMDWVGVCLLGCVTALGGGSLRDVLLGHYPLLWVANPSYLALTAGAALFTIMIARVVHRLHLAFLVLDAAPAACCATFFAMMFRCCFVRSFMPASRRSRA
jgi:uncharacterized membrane protein YeiH